MNDTIDYQDRDETPERDHRLMMETLVKEIDKGEVSIMDERERAIRADED